MNFINNITKAIRHIFHMNQKQEGRPDSDTEPMNLLFFNRMVS